MTRQEWTPNNTQQAAMSFLASCLGFAIGVVGGLMTLILFCLLLGSISQFILS